MAYIYKSNKKNTPEDNKSLTDKNSSTKDVKYSDERKENTDILDTLNLGSGA